MFPRSSLNKLHSCNVSFYERFSIGDIRQITGLECELNIVDPFLETVTQKYIRVDIVMMFGADNGKLPLSKKYILMISSYVYFHIRIWGHILRGYNVKRSYRLTRRH